LGGAKLNSNKGGDPKENFWDNDDNLSVMSNTSEGNKSKRQKIRRPIEVYFPVVCLAAYFCIEMLPLLVNCITLRNATCMDWDSIVNYPILKIFQDAGNMAIFVMMILTMRSVSNLQSQRFANLNNESLRVQSLLAFSFGIVTAGLYLTWIILESRPILQTDLGLQRLAFYNGFLFFISGFNLMNILLLRNSVADRNQETFTQSNAFKIKCIFFGVPTKLTIAFFVFEIMNAINQTGKYTNYVAFFGTAAVFLQMVNFATYSFDIDFISKMLTLKEDSQYFVDKKLKLNNL